ncbi:MAG: MFS transporter [Candidatus Dormibacteraeota bacterium]|nr:MFS transporter [Candidatus Dormibacteraeota bacterium]
MQDLATVSTGGLVLLGGRASDLLGRRQVFLTGLLIFTAASLTSGLAPSPAALVVSRAAQGLGASLLTPGALSIITTYYAGAQRAAGLAAWGAIGAAGSAAGVLLGGALTTALGWQSIFFVNVPIGIAAGALALRMVPRSPARIRDLRELDLAGAAVLVAGLVLLVFAIQGTAVAGWGSARTLVPLLVSFALLAAFGVQERRAARPLIPTSTWRLRSLILGAAVMSGATAIMTGTSFLNSLYLQQVLGESALSTGLAFLPATLAIVAAAQLASRLIAHAGTKPVLLLGLAVIAGGAIFLAQMPAHPDYFVNILPGFLAVALGLGLTFVSVPITAMSNVREEIAGLASGLITTGHETGAALGVATLSAIASAVAISGSFASGYRAGFWAAAAMAAALALVSLLAVPGVRPAAGSGVRVH